MNVILLNVASAIGWPRLAAARTVPLRRRSLAAGHQIATCIYNSMIIVISFMIIAGMGARDADQVLLCRARSMGESSAPLGGNSTAGAAMEESNFRGGMRVAIVALTAFLALSQPMRLAFASMSPAAARAMGSPHLQNLPAATIVVITVAVILHSVLMVMVVREIWRLARGVEGGAFFTKENVAAIKRVGIYLIITAALDVAALAMAVASVWLSGRELEPVALSAQIFNLPAAALLCGLLSLVVARAFDRALKMAREARYTV